MDQRMIAHRRPIAITALDHRRRKLRPLQDQASLRLVPGERDRFVEQRLVGDDPPGLEPAARG